MTRRFGIALLTLPVAAALAAGSALAQSYPPPPPHYRSGPPPGPYYDDQLPPPGYYDEEKDIWVTPRPPRGQRYTQGQRGPAGAPTRVLPYPDEAEADVPPPPPGFATPPAYGHQLGPQQAPPPAARYEPDVIRPPGTIGPGQPAAPQQAAPQQGTPQQGTPATSVMTLPPEDQPETGQPKELPANLQKQLVDYVTKEPPGTLIVDTPNTYLYLVLGNSKALRYGIGVGREGFTWTGTERISKMKEWPDWFPPPEMIERQPYLPRIMAGGPGNPLGARALYLGNTLYRIHGTNQPSTIGSFVSSGCIRLLNEDIEDLYSRVQVGTRVVVLPGKQPETVATGPVPPAAGGSAPGPANAPHNTPGITSSQLPPAVRH